VKGRHEEQSTELLKGEVTLQLSAVMVWCVVCFTANPVAMSVSAVF
jgi:hypothetical protein